MNATETDLMKAQLWCVLVLRGVGVFLVVFGLILICAALGGLLMELKSSLNRQSPSQGAGTLEATSILVLLFGAIEPVGLYLVFMADSLARKLVPTTYDFRCPRCHYSLRSVQHYQCPECGGPVRPRPEGIEETDGDGWASIDRKQLAPLRNAGLVAAGTGGVGLLVVASMMYLALWSGTAVSSAIVLLAFLSLMLLGTGGVVATLGMWTPRLIGISRWIDERKASKA